MSQKINTWTVDKIYMKSYFQHIKHSKQMKYHRRYKDLNSAMSVLKNGGLDRFVRNTEV